MNESKAVFIPRLLSVPDRSFFLFGPRGTGKSTWLRHVLPEALFIDLLNSSLYLELSRAPDRLEAIGGNRPAESWIVLDEIQKVPMLLDEVHRLMESRRWRFVLCGSSARKLRRGGANLLAGRALTLKMEGFSAQELGAAFDLEFCLNWGMLPFVHRNPDQAADILSAYLDTYIKEEIREEGLIRRVPQFIRFLSIAGQINGQVINMQNVSREAAVARSTVESYFSILEDTLLGHFLPAWRPGLKVRESSHPKFFWFDPGVARAAAGWLRDPVDRIWQGASLETLLFHELRVYNETQKKHRPIFYYRTPSGVEVDFIIETSPRRAGEPSKVVAVEVKRAEKWTREWENPLRSLTRHEDLRVERLIAVYAGSRSYRFGDIDVLPVKSFIEELYSGQVF